MRRPRMVGVWRVFDAAWEMMARVRLVPPVDRGGLYAEFISFVAALQVAIGEQAMVMPVNITAAELNLKPRTISILIGWAVDDGLLVLVQDHSVTDHVARSFRFALEHYPELEVDPINVKDEIRLRLEGIHLVTTVFADCDTPEARSIPYAGPQIPTAVEGKIALNQACRRARSAHLPAPPVKRRPATKRRAETGGVA